MIIKRYGCDETIGVCDRSGFVFKTSELCKQMEWRGDRLVWTGLLVGRPYLDVPDEQLRTVKTKHDPKPVKNPRPVFATAHNYDDITTTRADTLEDRLNHLTFTHAEPVKVIRPPMFGEDVSKENPIKVEKKLERLNFDEVV